MRKDNLEDQTQFFAESTLYEEPVADVSAAAAVVDQQLAKQKKIKQIVFGLGAVAVSVFIIFVIQNSRKTPLVDNNFPAQDELPDVSISGPLGQRLEELSQELELADPTQEKLPFPPINSKISLEE